MKGTQGPAPARNEASTTPDQEGRNSRPQQSGIKLRARLHTLVPSDSVHGLESPTNTRPNHHGLRLARVATVSLTLLLAGRCPLPAGDWISFVDVAAEAGVKPEIVYGGVERQEYILESAGTGVAIFDYDHDGRPDIFFVNGSRLDLPAEKSPSNRLYRNLGDWEFEDTTAKAGLVQTGWGQASCVGDYDNDGWTDLNVTYYGGNRLYRNRGDGSFEEVAKKAGVETADRWNTGCTFLDYDKDGDLDLFMANYVHYDDAAKYEPGSGPNCKWEGMDVLCGPTSLQGSHNILYRNNGDGTFTDVSAPSAITRADGYYCFMPVTLDFDGDAWTDIYVACDATPNILYHNNRDGTFTDIGMESGAALNGDGQEQAGMGVGVGDYNLDGRPDLLVTNFAGETTTLYRNGGGRTFTDVTLEAKLGSAARYLSWGAGLVDLNNDGRQDIFVASGHVYPEVDQHASPTTYRQPMQVFANLGDGTFQDMSSRSGEVIGVKKASRGAAFNDLDGDGDLDVVVTNINDRPCLLRNDGGEKRNWLRIRLEGVKSNRSGIGARIEVTHGDQTQVDEVRSASSYYSSSGLTLHFGLGTAQEAAYVEVHWPSGKRQTFKKVAGNRTVSIHEREGIRGEAVN